MCHRRQHRRFALRLMLLLSLAPATYAEFNQHYQLQGITFQVKCANASSLNQLIIIPSGLSSGNDPLISEIDGSVSGAQVADLDGDSWPEIYVFINSAGSGSYGSLSAYAVKNGTSLSSIYLPPVTNDLKLSAGYGGHDQFHIDGNRLIQRFPLYQRNDTQRSPSAGFRQISYRLLATQSGWVLQRDQVTEQAH